MREKSKRGETGKSKISLWAVVFAALLFLAGAAVFLYPAVSNWLAELHQSSVIQEYEKELAAETLLTAQGFDEVVVSINDACADVVVSSSQVSDAERAQIEDVVKRKTGIEAANITITPVTAE